mgnify:CR=1 FL=1
MAKSLVIVESPTKARTLSRFIDGKDVYVKASMGHIRDLPETSLGVQIENNFQPKYQMTSSGKKAIAELKKTAKEVDHIYIATDPDREGEAIAWHIQEVLREHTEAQFHRVTFHEITKDAIQHAFQEPEDIDTRKVHAQQARRVLDRLVGYKVSPLLWKHIRRGTSAGRVQSVALRMVCEREREIQNFVPVEYWTLNARFLPEYENALSFDARLVKLDNKKPEIPDAETANRLADELETSASFSVSNVQHKTKQRRPSPPFITSTLQQVAGNSLRMSANQTMRIAQQLYEGIDVGEGGPSGLITYMRTDSVAVAKEAQDAAREHIAGELGDAYVPKKPNTYKSKQSAQEAHEAIRPTDVHHTPEKVAPYLDDQQAKLYRLIWRRFVASQMTPAKMDEHRIEVTASGDELSHAYLFRATATTVQFPGFLKIYDTREQTDDAQKQAKDDVKLPELDKDTSCRLESLEKKQHFTEPPGRYSEATLVRALEENGVGRPSTYATIVSTVQQRRYAQKSKGKLYPTELGFQVNDYLTSRLNHLFEVPFTARMEEELDEIEQGKLDWQGMLGDFYSKFSEWVSSVDRLNVPAQENVQKLINALPVDDINWEEPTKRGGKKYDDRKFFESLRKQVEEKGTSLTDKQWSALLSLCAKYADQIPDIWRIADELDVTEQVQEMAEKYKEEKERASGEKPPQPEHKELLDALTHVTFNEPVKRGRKTYDDRKFYESLKEQLTEKGALTEAQFGALKKLVQRYRGQVQNYEELAEKYSLDSRENDQGVDHEQIKALIEMLDQIQEWREPTQRGKRTYDDKKFAESIKEQYNQKGSLSSKQLNALKKTLSRYAEQISDYEQKRETLGLPEPKEEQNKTSSKS